MIRFSRRSLLSVFLAVSGIISVSAKTLTFPVHGLEVKSAAPVPTKAEWEENWLLENEPTHYHHGIARIAAMLSEISYIPVEKNPQSNEMIESYRLLGFEDEHIEWNYVLDYTAELSGNNQAAYSFAFKDFQGSKDGKKLVFVVLRGTPLGANEWISNVNVSDSTKKDTQTHEGFLKTSTNIKLALYDFLQKNKIDAENARFLLTGHSRGAALANLLGATLADEGVIPPKNLFVYTFASPNVSQEEKTASKDYDFIWNIVNAEDIVPTVPPNRNRWKWKKFGQTKVLANYWNTNPETYLNDYLPRMNEYYKTFLLRDYAPFKVGPFIHIQVARILTNLYKTVESYYRSFFGLRNMSEQIFLKAFPEKSENEQKNETKLPFLVRLIQKTINENIEDGFDYAINALVDMHACESYLSWMLALDENEAFSEMENFQIVLKGSYDCAVYNSSGEQLCRILDGSVELFSLKAPVSACPLPNETVIGFPKNQNLSVVIHKDSLFPTAVSYELEHYDAAGILLHESEDHYFFPRTGTVLRFDSGSINISTEKISAESIRGTEAKNLSKQYGLKQNLTFKVHGEFGVTSDKIFSAGLRAGTQEVYASLLGVFFKKQANNLAGFSLGLGHQHSLYGRIMLDIEAAQQFLWVKTDDFQRTFAAVPNGKLSISYKPRHSLQFFAGLALDLHISDFNDEAFSDCIRKNHFSAIKCTDKIEAFPSLQFGIRF